MALLFESNLVHTWVLAAENVLIKGYAVFPSPGSLDGASNGTALNFK